MPTKMYNLVTDGNSITVGLNLNTDQAWPAVCRGLLFADQASHANKFWAIKSTAVAGATTPQRTAAFTNDVQSQFSVAYVRNIVTFFEVVNDVVTNAATLQTAINNVTLYVNQARTAGWDVMLSTATPTTNVANGAGTVVNNFNTYLRANPSLSDFPIVDLAANANLSDPTNLTYYQGDGLHPTAAGAAVIAQLFHDALVAVVDTQAPDTLGLVKQIVYDFDQLEKSSPSTWTTKVAAIIPATYRKLFQGGNMDRLRYRYSVYGFDKNALAAVYSALVTAFSP